VTNALAGELAEDDPDMGIAARNFVSGMAGDIANAATRTLVTGSDFGDNLIAALPDTIGQTIGNAVAGGEDPSTFTDAEGDTIQVAPQSSPQQPATVAASLDDAAIIAPEEIAPVTADQLNLVPLNLNVDMASDISASNQVEDARVTGTPTAQPASSSSGVYSQDAAGHLIYTYPGGATTQYDPDPDNSDTGQWSAPSYAYSDGTVRQYNETTGQWSDPMEQAVVTGSLDTSNAGWPSIGQVLDAIGNAIVPSANAAERGASQTPNLRITDAERLFAKQGNVEAYYRARLAQGDPVAAIGLASLHPSGGPLDYLFGGTSVNNRLEAFSLVYTGHSIDLNAVRLDLMNAEINAIDSDPTGNGSLSPGQIYDYHVQVFQKYGLPSTAFGGSPMTGERWEAYATSPIWYGKSGT
jgi:hypothetical protein